MTTASAVPVIQREPGLPGQTVVVIGGSAGIGLETARRARAEGADVVLTGRDPDRLKQVAAELGAQRTAAFDASDAASVERFFHDLPRRRPRRRCRARRPHHEQHGAHRRDVRHRRRAAVRLLVNTRH